MSTRVQRFLSRTPPETQAAIRAAFWRRATPAQSKLVSDWVTATVMRGPPPPELAAGLTFRQVQMLAYAAEGASMRDTATALGIDFQTVKLHRRYAIRHLGARNITHAVAIWLRSPEDTDGVYRDIPG